MVHSISGVFNKLVHRLVKLSHIARFVENRMMFLYHELCGFSSEIVHIIFGNISQH